MRKLGSFQQRVFDVICAQVDWIQGVFILHQCAESRQTSFTRSSNMDFSRVYKTIDRLIELGLVEQIHRGRTDWQIRRVI